MYIHTQTFFGTHHASLKFLHIVKVMLQTYNAGNPASVPLSLWQWHSIYACQSLSDLAPVCLSVCFNAICHCRLCACLSVWPSICSIRQSIPFVFDSWCVTLRLCPSEVIQVPCARAASPGVTSSLFPFFFWECTSACKTTCNASTSKGMHLCTLDDTVKGCYTVGPVAQCDLWHCCGQIVSRFK